MMKAFNLLSLRIAAAGFHLALPIGRSKCDIGTDTVGDVKRFLHEKKIPVRL